MHNLSALLFLLFVVVALLEKGWKYYQVNDFLREPFHKAGSPLPSVSILQPILSGDPTLPACLEANLRQQTQYQLEFIWLVDEDDFVGQRICKELAHRYAGMAIRIVVLPAPAPHQNPKMVKLIAGMQSPAAISFAFSMTIHVSPIRAWSSASPHLTNPMLGWLLGCPTI